MKKSVCICSVILACYINMFAQKIQTPIPVDDILKGWSFVSRSPIDVSPDGKWVAYILYNQHGKREQIADERNLYFSRSGVPLTSNGTALWVTEVDTGNTIRIVEEGFSAWGASWAPNSRSLAFYSDRNGQTRLWQWDIQSREIKLLSDVIPKPFMAYDIPKWSPDGKKILVKVIPEGVIPMESYETPLLQKSSNEGVSKNKSSVILYKAPISESTKIPTLELDIASAVYRSDIALVSVNDGNIERIARNYSPTAYSFSPDGNKIAFVNYKGHKLHNPALLQDIYIMSLQNKSTQLVASDVPMSSGLTYSWSPDSRMLAYFTSGRNIKGDCHIIDLQANRTKNLTYSITANFGSNETDINKQPLWDNEGKNIYVATDNKLYKLSVANDIHKVLGQNLNRDIKGVVAPWGRNTYWHNKDNYIMVFTFNKNNYQSGIYKINKMDDTSQKIKEDDKNYLTDFGCDTTTDNSQLFFVCQDSQQYPDVWMIDNEFKYFRRVTRTNLQLDKYEMGKSQLIEWKTEKGELIKGALLLPAGYQPGKQYPVIVNVYGGDYQSKHLNKFGLIGAQVNNCQLLATRGYVVFAPDMPIRSDELMKSITESVVSGVHKLVEMGIADPNRLAITGHSFGGYCVLALITQTNIFKAAISRAGFGNLLSMYGQMSSDGSSWGVSFTENGHANLGGPPWLLRDKYIENSPYFYLDKVSTPLLLIHGSVDPVVKSHLADETFVAMRRLGKVVQYAKYFGEEHNDLYFTYGNAIDTFERTLKWFDERLK